MTGSMAIDLVLVFAAIWGAMLAVYVCILPILALHQYVQGKKQE